VQDFYSFAAGAFAAVSYWRKVDTFFVSRGTKKAEEIKLQFSQRAQADAQKQKRADRRSKNNFSLGERQGVQKYRSHPTKKGRGVERSLVCDGLQL
jgi:hypothetical protein